MITICTKYMELVENLISDLPGGIFCTIYATAFMSRVETDFCFFCSFVPTVIFLSLLALIPRFATTFAAKKDKAVPSSRRRPVMIGWTLINYLAPTPLPTTGSCLGLLEMAKNM